MLNIWSWVAAVVVVEVLVAVLELAAVAVERVDF